MEAYADSHWSLINSDFVINGIELYYTVDTTESQNSHLLACFLCPTILYMSSYSLYIQLLFSVCPTAIICMSNY